MLTVAEAKDNESWEQAIDDIQLAINTAPHRVTKVSPMELKCSNGQPVLIEAKGELSDNSDVELDRIRSLADAEIHKSAAYNKSLFDKGKAKVKPFDVGELVLLKNKEINQKKT